MVEALQLHKQEDEEEVPDEEIQPEEEKSPSQDNAPTLQDRKMFSTSSQLQLGSSVASFNQWKTLLNERRHPSDSKDLNPTKAFAIL